MQFVCKYSGDFERTEHFMTLRHIIPTFVLILAFVASSQAGPARKGDVFLRQPDGSVFKAKVIGDEFIRIKTDEAGHAIVQDEDGWWSYALYKEDGTKMSSGCKVGKDVPFEMLSASARIPYEALSRKAKDKRSLAFKPEESPILERMIRKSGIRTKAEDENAPMLKHGLVILASFKDVQFKHSREDFVRLLTEQGYAVNGATGSAKEYFDAQFQGLMEFDFHVTEIIVLPNDRKDYGGNNDEGNDKAPAKMIEDACKLADSQVDFSKFDDDDDGEVDNVFLFFAGQDEAEGASEECIWSHAWHVKRGAGIDLKLDGTVIDRYACSSELTISSDSDGKIHESINGIGTFCHEYSHTLGLPDFYDTDYEESGGISAGLWIRTSLMDGGNYNNYGNTPPYYNAIERMIAGISSPEILEKTGTYTLAPIHQSGKSYMLKTDSEDEFFLFECRSNSDWDRYIGGKGMLAYRIKVPEGGYDRWLTYNNVNIDPLNQSADLIEADGRSDSFATSEDFTISYKNIAGIFYPYLETDSIDADGKRSLTAIRNENGTIRFSFLGNDDTRVPPVAVNIVKEAFADAAIINFESSYPYEGEAEAAWGRPEEEKKIVKIQPHSPGKYALILENLESPGKTYEIEITFKIDDVEGEMKKTSIMTKRMPSSAWPYIYLGSMERNPDGTFPAGSRSPLRVYGATGATEISWTFNGSTIRHDGDGYYTLKESGILQAVIYWEDGSRDKVMKEIIIK